MIFESLVALCGTKLTPGTSTHKVYPRGQRRDGPEGSEIGTSWLGDREAAASRFRDAERSV